MAALEDKLTALAAMSPAQLRAEWLRGHKSPAPAMTPDLLRRAVAYRLQEQAYGGLKPAVKRGLERLGAEMDRTEPVAVGSLHIKPGTRLVREWNGRTITVEVHNDGFRHAGRNWRSLSEIARYVTGAHWSGPRFFGLTPRA